MSGDTEVIALPAQDCEKMAAQLADRTKECDSLKKNGEKLSYELSSKTDQLAVLANSEKLRRGLERDLNIVMSQVCAIYKL